MHILKMYNLSSKTQGSKFFCLYILNIIFLHTVIPLQGDTTEERIGRAIRKDVLDSTDQSKNHDTSHVQERESIVPNIQMIGGNSEHPFVLFIIFTCPALVHTETLSLILTTGSLLNFVFSVKLIAIHYYEKKSEPPYIQYTR